jgi:hypothetical protein
MENRVDLDKLNKRLGVRVFICANRECLHYDMDAVMMLYPSSVYCSTKCKYNDTDMTHKESYGD